jgi:hypothetical protein
MSSVMLEINEFFHDAWILETKEVTF